MEKGKSYLIAVSAVAALGLSFWGGRTTAPGDGGSSVENGPSRSSSGRGNERAASQVSSERQNHRGKGSGKMSTGSESAPTSLSELKSLTARYGEAGYVRAMVAIGNMDSEQVARLAREMNANSATGFADWGCASALFGRWADLDPESALQEAMAMKGKRTKQVALGVVLSALASSDPDMALQKVSSLEDSGLKDSLYGVVMSSIGGRDPERWLAWIKENPTMSSNLSGMVAQWAEEDPAAAAERLKSMPTQGQDAAVGMLGQIWAAKDLVAAKTWAESLGDNRQRSQALSAIAMEIAEKDPAGAMAFVAEMPSGDKRMAMHQVLGSLAFTDFGSAVDQSLRLPEAADRQMALDALIGHQGWGSVDPSKVTKVLESMPKGEGRSTLLNRIGEDLSRSAHPDVEGLMKTLSPEDQQVLQSSYISGLSRKDPVKAMELLADMPDSERKSSAYGQVIRQLGERNPDEAAKQIAQLPEGSDRNAGVKGLAGAWAEKDPTATVKWVESLTGNEQKLAASASMSVLGWSDPTRAVELYENLAARAENEGREMDSGLTLAVTGPWAEKDPAAAVKWVAGLREGRAKDTALMQAIGVWRRSDSSSARQAIDVMKISDEMRNRLLQQFPKEERQ